MRTLSCLRQAACCGCACVSLAGFCIDCCCRPGAVALPLVSACTFFQPCSHPAVRWSAAAPTCLLLPGNFGWRGGGDLGAGRASCIEHWCMHARCLATCPLLFAWWGVSPTRVVVEQPGGRGPVPFPSALLRCPREPGGPSRHRRTRGGGPVTWGSTPQGSGCVLLGVWPHAWRLGGAAAAPRAKGGGLSEQRTVCPAKGT